MSGVAGSILQHVGEDLFEEHVVFPVASVIAELLESLPSVFVSFFPKFCGVSPKTLPVPVLASGLLRALEKEAASEVDEETSLALFVASAWIEENLAMYSFVEERLKRELGANFEFVEVVEEHTSDVLAREVTEAFGPIRAFLFCVLSSVRLAPGSLRRMRAVAEAAHSEQRAEIDDLVRSCELLQTRVTTVSSPSVVSPVSQLSRSLDERALRQLATPSPARRWQLMRGVLPSPDQTRHRHAKMQEHRHHNLPDQQVHHHHHHQQQQQQHLGSHLARRVEAREHRGWLDKSRKVDLVESGVALASTARSWKRRWVVLEDGKCSYFLDESGGEPLGCIPLYLVSSIRTISPCSFCIRCGHVANFVFRSDSEEETKGWLFGIQQWLATLNFGSRDEALVQSVLAVPRWWKKLRSKQSLAEYTQLV